MNKFNRQNWSRLKQRLSKYLHQPWFGGGFGCLLTIGIGLILYLTPVGNGFRDLSYDLPFLVRSGTPDTNVVVIYLDEETYKSLNATPSNFDRTNHAQLLHHLKAEGARLVLFDIYFDKNKPTASDAGFAQAMREFGNVVIGALYEADQERDRTILSAPLPILQDATPGSNSWGLTAIHRDADLAARQLDPGSEDFPCLAWKAGELLGAKVAKTPEKRGEKRWLNYYAKEPLEKIPYW